MRRVLIDYARKHARRARLLARSAFYDNKLDLLKAPTSEEENADKLLELDEALQRFAQKFPAQAEVVELKYFGGMTVQQCADDLGICTATVQRYWNFARAWIGREMERIRNE
jgi:RNA polymerase sigma factor (TIGR02999 family)